MHLLDLSEWYETYRPLLFSLAYHMTGTAADAEDVVHDVFVTLEENGHHVGEIRDVKAYLCKMAANRCLNIMKSARKKRETYVGPWLPEPLAAAHEPGPLAVVEDREAVSYALMVVMEQLSPMERAVFVLREAYGFAYRELAELLEKNEANCRKIYSRAKQKVERTGVDPLPPPEREEEQVRELLAAFTSGDVNRLLHALTDDVVFLSDGGGKVRAALRPIVGISRVLAMLKGVIAKRQPVDAAPEWFNGRPGFVLREGGRVTAAVSLALSASTCQVKAVYLVTNPDKLARLTKAAAR